MIVFSNYCGYVIAYRRNGWTCDGKGFRTYNDAIAYVDSLNNY